MSFPYNPCSHCDEHEVGRNSCPRCGMCICEQCYQCYNYIFGEVVFQGLDENNVEIRKTNFEQTMDGIGRYDNMVELTDADRRVMHVLHDNYDNFIVPLVRCCDRAHIRGDERTA